MCGVGLFGEADINHIICLHHILCAPTQDAVCSKYLTSESVFSLFYAKNCLKS